MVNEYDKLVNKLSGQLDSLMTRGKLIASNIANIDTPGFKAKDVDFNKILSDNMGIQMTRTNSRHMGESQSIGTQAVSIEEDPNPGRADGNNVDIDDQMLKLSENNIQYSIATQLLSKKLRQMQDVIQQSAK